MYIELGMSLKQIGDELGCDSNTVSRWCDKYGIEKRTPDNQKPPNYRTDSTGYECWSTDHDGESMYVYVHRLLAVSEYGLESVADRHIHHKNGVPWDNRPENIEPVSPEEHAKEHHHR